LHSGPSLKLRRLSSFLSTPFGGLWSVDHERLSGQRVGVLIWDIAHVSALDTANVTPVDIFSGI